MQEKQKSKTPDGVKRVSKFKYDHSITSNTNELSDINDMNSPSSVPANRQYKRAHSNKSHLMYKMRLHNGNLSRENSSIDPNSSNLNFQSNSKSGGYKNRTIFCERFFNLVNSKQHFQQLLEISRRNSFLIVQNQGDHLELNLPENKFFDEKYFGRSDFFYMSVTQEQANDGWIKPPKLQYYKNKNMVLEKPLETEWTMQILRILEMNDEVFPHNVSRMDSPQPWGLKSGFNSGLNSIAPSNAG